MRTILAFLLIAAKFLFLPIFLIIYPAVRGYTGSPIHWILVWIPSMAIVSALIDLEFSKMTSGEKMGFFGTVGAVLFLSIFKLIVFIPVGAISFFGAAALAK